MPPKVGIVLINYKTYAQRFLTECARTLAELNYPKDSYRVYVTDNVTSPETQAQIKEIADWVTIVPSDGNGWGHGNNVGAKQAIKDGFADYLCFWNMDTEFEPDCLKEVIDVMEADKTIGIAQSKILLFPQNDIEKQSPLLNTIGNAIHYLGFSFTLGYRQSVDTAPTKVTNISSASGCGMTIRGEVYDQIGGCDERLFMYHDDLELSYKARLMGQRVVLIPDSIIWHKYEFDRSIMQVYYMERNRLLALVQYYKWPSFIIILPALIFMELGMLPYSMVNGWLGTKLQVYGYFLKPSTWREIIKFRKDLHSKRQLKDSDIMATFTGKIEFQEVANPLLQYVANPILSSYWWLAKKVIWW